MQMYDAIEIIGYSEETRNYLNIVANVTSKVLTDIMPIDEKFMFCANVVGSICEGTFLESSDIDIICYTKLAVCTDGSFHRHAFKTAETEMDTQYPGYVFLWLNDDAMVKEQLPLTQKRNGKHYLSSKLFMDEQFKDAFKAVESQPDIKRYAIHGPALSVYLECDDYKGNMDITCGYIFHCPTLINQFIERTSSREWPPDFAKRKIAALPAFLVPTGQKGSKLRRLQWRICFNFAETVLVHCMNDIQYKVFVLMKAFTKKNLAPVCKEITSFLVKNVLFWMCDQLPPEAFLRSNIFNIFILGLTNLRDCIIKRQLDYYMIPTRNLLDSIVSNKQRDMLITVLNRTLLESLMQIRTTPIVKFLETPINRQCCTELDMFSSLNCNTCKQILFKKRKKNRSGKFVCKRRKISENSECFTHKETNESTTFHERKRLKTSEKAEEKRNKFIEFLHLLKEMGK